MDITFSNKALEELYKTGHTYEKEYRKLPTSVIKRYIKIVNYLKAASRVEDLYVIKSLHYEKKKGDLKGIETVWINDQYRLMFNSSPDESGIIVNALLLKTSKHYEN